MHPKNPQSPADALVAQSDRATVSVTVAPDAATVREDLEQWAARVAPTLDADGWRRAEPCGVCGFTEHAPGWSRVPCGECSPLFSPAQRRALLAYRDSVAAGLSTGAQSALREACSLTGFWSYGPTARHRDELRGAALSEKGHGTYANDFATDFGREVARVLGGDR